MAKQFDFLARAKPAALYRLLRRLPLEDACVVLVGLPHSVAVQVMAYYPEDVQGDLLPAMREARRAAPERVDGTAARVREMLKAAKEARDGGASPPSRPEADVPPVSGSTPPAAPRPAPMAPSEARRAQAYRAAPPPSPPPGAGSPPPAGKAREKPSLWRPRAATSSPINGPALPGKPPSISGDPLESPLARAGLLDLIGRAQEKLLPGKRPPAKAPPRAAERRTGRPEPSEGVARRGEVEFSPTRRVIGPAAKKAGPPPDAPAGGTAARPRRMDGKAILAAILREAGPDVRNQVREDDPALFRELRGRMFYFDDLLLSADDALARVFTTAPVDDAALALKFAAPALRARVLRAVSPGRARALADAPPGRAGLDDIERAQKKVLGVALQLQSAGRILIDPRDPDLAGGE